MKPTVFALAAAAALTLALTLTLPAPAAMAQTPAGGAAWPTRPITMIVPFAPGAVDAAARAIAERAAQTLGQPIVADNKPGAGQRLGTTALLRAPKDGYTFGVLTTANASITPAIDPKAGYDPLKDLTPLTLAYESPYVVIVHPSLGVRTLAELFARAKSAPGKLNYGSTGVGASYHLWFEVLQDMSGTRFTHVPYKGEALAMQDLLGGEIQVMLAGSLAKAHVDTGKAVALATTGRERWGLFANAPTVTEAGGPNFVATGWLGFAAPGGLAPEITRRLADALREALRSPEVSARLAKFGVTIRALDPAATRAVIASEIEQFRHVATANNIRLE